jgi:hypothetical protein
MHCIHTGSCHKRGNELRVSEGLPASIAQVARSGSTAAVSAWGPGVGLWCLVCCWDKQPPGSIVVQVRPLPIPYFMFGAVCCPRPWLVQLAVLLGAAEV